MIPYGAELQVAKTTGAKVKVWIANTNGISCTGIVLYSHPTILAVKETHSGTVCLINTDHIAVVDLLEPAPQKPIIKVGSTLPVRTPNDQSTIKPEVTIVQTEVAPKQPPKSLTEAFNEIGQKPTGA